LILEFSWSKIKNLNTVVETKMSGVEIFKMFDMHFYGIWSHIIGGKIDSGGGNFTKNY
jgi:hypothetical protein